MKDPNKLFDEITSELTSKGQIFETRDVTNDKGVSYKGMFHFLIISKGILILDYCMAIKNF